MYSITIIVIINQVKCPDVTLKVATESAIYMFIQVYLQNTLEHLKMKPNNSNNIKLIDFIQAIDLINI